MWGTKSGLNFCPLCHPWHFWRSGQELHFASEIMEPMVGIDRRPAVYDCEAFTTETPENLPTTVQFPEVTKTTERNLSELKVVTFRIEIEQLTLRKQYIQHVLKVRQSVVRGEFSPVEINYRGH